ncbi:hypothetical protein RND71_008244 [Anisodus tanguticus]|uniref:Uncharacterized protein n=1 Tax=Anisodus tanguticus TaxID=243964 RepID=A0AAE1SND3_9SOLA|nr:hypothetical protein RND71_008244 [Anisodus tanguticus]
MNSTNKDARELPVRRLLEYLTKLMAQWRCENKKFIKHNGMDPIQFCSFYNKKDYLMKTWEILVNPIPDESIWVVPREVMENMVLPPKGKRGTGRPRKKRCKLASEMNNNNNTLACKRCRTS